MFNLLRKQAYRWDDIGREFRVPYSDREELRREGVQSCPENKLERVLWKWVESKCSDVTWRKVIEVFQLLELDDNNVVKYLEENILVKSKYIQ